MPRPSVAWHQQTRSYMDWIHLYCLSLTRVLSPYLSSLSVMSEMKDFSCEFSSDSKVVISSTSRLHSTALSSSNEVITLLRLVFLHLHDSSHFRYRKKLRIFYFQNLRRLMSSRKMVKTCRIV